MKKIGILSDTHSLWDGNYEKVFKGCDEIWHCGDVGDISIIDGLREIAPVRAVYGNIDHGEVRRQLRESEIFTVEGVNVLLTHIGGYPGRYAPGIRTLLRDNNIRLFVDGHSHILKVMPDKALNLLHINPGAAGEQGWQKKRTLVRISLHEGDIKSCEVIELSRRI